MSNIKEAMDGNKEAFINIVEKYKVEIYKTAKAILKDEDNACDAMQESWISIYKNLYKLKNEKYFKTWAIRITINECYHILKKAKTDEEKSNKLEQQITNTQNEYDENKTEMGIALNKLEEDLRLIIVLYYYNDLSVKDIAEILKIPKGTVQSRLQRAREKLYEILKQEEVIV